MEMQISTPVVFCAGFSLYSGQGAFSKATLLERGVHMWTFTDALASGQGVILRPLQSPLCVPPPHHTHAQCHFSLGENFQEWNGEFPLCSSFAHPVQVSPFALLGDLNTKALTEWSLEHQLSSTPPSRTFLRGYFHVFGIFVLGI